VPVASRATCANRGKGSFAHRRARLGVRRHDASISDTTRDADLLEVEMIVRDDGTKLASTR
jgi:hypothetical protein